MKWVRSRRDRPAPCFALLLDRPEAVGFGLVGIITCRRRYQLRAFLPKVVETIAGLIVVADGAG
jgi:hypothetical protein